MVILEPDLYTREEIQIIKESGTKVIAYVTLGEVDPNRWYFFKLEERGFIGKNEIWNSYYVNLEDEGSRQILLSEVIPAILQKGPDGLFLDTIDAVSPFTDRNYLEPYMADMILKIRKVYPQLTLIQNSGHFLLDKTSDAVNAFMTESLASNYDFKTSAYILREDSIFRKREEYLNAISDSTDTPYFILEYADSDSARTILRNRLDPLNRPYFISNIGLSEIPENVASVANDLKQSETL